MGDSDLNFEPERYCKKCGYNLHKLVNPRCPECGQGFDPNNSVTFETETPEVRRRKRRNKILWRLFWLLLFLFAIAIILPLIIYTLKRGGSRPAPPRLTSAMQAVFLHDFCLEYAKDHQGNFPDNLGVLVKNGRISPNFCKSPLSDTPAPPSDLTIDQMAIWVNEHSDYAYIRPPSDSSLQKPQFMIFENFGAKTPDPVAVVLSDGSLKYLPISDVLTEVLKMLQPEIPNRTTPSTRP